MTMAKVSLEDIFIELTSGGAVPGEEDAQAALEEEVLAEDKEGGEEEE